MTMTIQDLVKAGAVTEQKTGDGKGESYTVARPMSDAEKEGWEAYKQDLQLGRQPEK